MLNLFKTLIKNQSVVPNNNNILKILKNKITELKKFIQY
jgi:hypothetical protein